VSRYVREDDLLLLEEVLKKLNLNGIGIDSATLFTNKYRMREELKADNLYHPKYRLCSSIEDVEQASLIAEEKRVIDIVSKLPFHLQLLF
jgi:hypothetical protein